MAPSCRSGAAGALLVLLLLSLPAALGQEAVRYSADYDIQPDLSVREQLTIRFAQPTANESVRLLRLPAEAADLSIADGASPLKFQTAQESGGSRVSVTLPVGSRELRASFTTREPIFSRGGEYRFFTSLGAPGGTDRLEASVTLPAGVLLLADRVVPSNASVSGRTLRWSLSRPSEEVALSVPFSPQATPVPWLYALAGGLGASSGGLFLFYFRRRVEEERFRGFSEDEQSALKFLQERREAYQEEIGEQFGFSMAKVSRMVKRFEAAGLVQKEKIGRSNRLTWKPALGARAGVKESEK